MPSSTILFCIYASQIITIYFVIPILIAGVIGGLLNIIIFRSIKTFRLNSCVFYLMIMSIVNIGQLITGLLSRIMISGFNIDWTQSSVFYCKFRWYYINVCAQISLTCMCFATLNQFLANYSNSRWQKWFHIRLAHAVTVISILIWLIYEIPCLIYNNIVVSLTTGQRICIITNVVFYQYYAYSSLWLFGGFLPLFINCLFGLLMYFNIQRPIQQTLPLIRRELNKQLTVMILVQVIYSFIAMVPFLIVSILAVDIIITNEPLINEKLQFANAVTTCLYYLNFAVSLQCEMYMRKDLSKFFKREY